MLASINRATLAILAGLAASPFAVVMPAAAQDTEITVRGLPEGTKMRLVSFGDLNLNLMAHREILDKRVGNAVREVCDVGAGNLRSPDYRNCTGQAWTGARPQITRAYVRAAQLAYGYRR
jgi:UrcA family protein